MKLAIFLSTCVALTMMVGAHNLIIGNVSKSLILVSYTKIRYYSIPFLERVKYFFYTQLDNRLILGIQALDNLPSESTITITAGGVGYPYVNLRMKSQRGKGLSYDIGIYVKNYCYH